MRNEMQSDERLKILAVVSDAETLAMVADVAGHSFDAHVTYANRGAEALDIDTIEPHDVVIAELDLEDMCGVVLTTELLAPRGRSVVLIADRPSVDDVVRAVRAGACDVLRPPLTHRMLFEALGRCLRREELARRDRRRQQRMRSLLRRVMHDRRGLNQRIDLVCRDIVGAQRRLFQRVVSGREHEG